MADRQPGPYLVFILTLSIFALAMLVADALLPLAPETRQILMYADFAVCVLFLIDFGITLKRAERKLHYLVRWGWIDLVSSIPAVVAFRWGRSLRAFRILRILRGVRAARIIAGSTVRQRAESTLMATALVT